MSSEIVIRVQNLSKCFQIYKKPHDRLKQSLYPRLQRLVKMKPKQYYKEFWALKDVSFEIEKGETVGIVGCNGSGKSTLLQIICGTIYPTGGVVETSGRIAALLELGSGFNPEFSGRDNVYLNASILGLNKQEIDEKFDAIEAFADIGEFIEQPVKTYSSGMFVRLAFAIQANVDPEILIVDEALAVGDTFFVHRCMLRFHELQKAGTSILFVSHDANAVRNLCSRAIWLADGGIKRQGNSAEVVDAYLADLFGQPEVPRDSLPENSKTIDHEILSNSSRETIIPNCDRRLGDQKCEITGVGLYDEHMTKITYSLNEKTVILRLTLQNHCVDAGTPLAVGYVFRNFKGQEIASTNSQIEEQVINPIAEKEYLTVRIKVSLPCLYPGSYAFSVAAGYIEDNGEIVLSDRIENAVVFDVHSHKQVNVMMNLPTVFKIEN
jgi:lipopolysaccharide transport system ATP-binding protein